MGVVEGENEKVFLKLMEIMNYVLGTRRELKVVVFDTVVESVFKVNFKLY